VDERLQAAPAPPRRGDALNEVRISIAQDECVRVTATGEFDAWSLNSLRSALTHGARSAPALRLDASGLTFADAATLGVLVATRRIAQANGCAFEIVDPSLQLRRVLRLTGLPHLLSPAEPAHRVARSRADTAWRMAE
jgi:anti-sigma B factor antagonist